MCVEQPRLVCVVEDDTDVRASARLLLEATGYRVADFANAEDFLRASDGRDASCLVFDLHMGGMTGLELLERLIHLRIVTQPNQVLVAGHPLLDMGDIQFTQAKKMNNPISYNDADAGTSTTA